MAAVAPVRIRFPVAVQKRVAKMLESPTFREKLELKRQPKVISCPYHPHYVNQNYKDKFKSIPMSSGTWFGRRSVGREFTILPFGTHSATSWWKSPKDKFVDSRDKSAGQNLSKPSFRDFDLDTRLCKALAGNGFEIPTNIQNQSIPKILNGEDVLITSETGNGKTLAFVVPILDKLIKEPTTTSPPWNSPRAVIAVPSRELALQIYGVITDLGIDGLETRCVLGGSIKNKTLHGERGPIDIVVGTIGALNKLFRNRYLHSKRIKSVVMDEADSLLDDTFSDRSISLMSFLDRGNESTGFQLILAGATLPGRNWESVVGRVINDPEQIVRVSTEDLHRVPRHIRQKFIRTSKTGKLDVLLREIEQDLLSKRPILIFANKASTADWLKYILNEKSASFPAVNLTNNVDFRIRHSHLDSFMNGEVSVLTATDLGSRGLDIKSLHHVVNYDFPLNMSDYIHRVGRVGRVGHNHGAKVTNLVCTALQIELVQKIEESVRLNTRIPNVNSNVIQLIESKRNDKHLA